MKKPKISVIVPVYNVADYIARCANSLLMQTLSDIEYIFINDCTPDNSIQILKSVIANYPDKQQSVKIYSMSKNSGQSAVRRYGITLANGEYIIFCDSDDWVDKDHCNLLWEEARRKDLDIVICDYFKTDGETHMHKTASNPEYSDVQEYHKHLTSGHISTAVWNKLVKRSLYQNDELKFPLYNMWEDFVINIQIFYMAKRIGYIPIPLYYYYSNPNSICNSDISDRMKQIKGNSLMILDFIKSKNLYMPNDPEILQFKYYSRSEMSMYVGKRKYRLEWRNFYPEINSQFIKNKYIPIREKIKFISLYLGIYPFIMKIKHLISSKII